MGPAPVTFSIGDKLTAPPSSEASLNCPLTLVLSFAAPPADLSSSCMAPSSSPFSAEASLPSAAAGEEAGIILEIAEPRCKRVDLVAKVEDERRVWHRSPRLDGWFLFLWRGMLTLVLVLLVLLLLLMLVLRRRRKHRRLPA